MLKSRQDFRMYCYSTYQKSFFFARNLFCAFFLPAIFFVLSSQGDKNPRNNTYIFQHKRIQYFWNKQKEPHCMDYEVSGLQ